MAKSGDVFPFRPSKSPWLIEDRSDRMRYLFNHFVWENTVCQVFLEDQWFVAKSDKGQSVVPLWPTQDSAAQSLGRGADLGFKTLETDTIEAELFGKMYEDECLALFPNAALEYEIFTVPEFRQAWDFSLLLKKDFEGTLTSEEEKRLLSQYRLW